MGTHFKSRNDGDDQYHVRYGDNLTAPTGIAYANPDTARDSARRTSRQTGTAAVVHNGRIIARYRNGQPA
jgi:hypothetical protein